jgi:antitoxin FitA
MKSFSIQLPDQTVERIERAARELGVSSETLVRATLEEKLDQLNAGFEEAAQHVLQKNAELYRRLA